VPHPNARLTPQGRRLLADRIVSGWTITKAADAAGISRQTGSKWWSRSKVGEFVDRSSAPLRPAVRHGPDVVAALCARRRERRVGPHVLGWEVQLAPSTAYAILRRHDLGRLDRLEPRPPVVRYERERPGELVHLDTKQLARVPDGGGYHFVGRAVRAEQRGTGWDRVHVAIDDHSRLAYAEELADEQPGTTVAFLQRAVGFFADHGIAVERVLTDNGNPYRSRHFRQACSDLGIAARRTRPYRPQTNGKAERLIRTLLAEWAYRTTFNTTTERVSSLAPYLDFYNRRRPHWSLAGQSPISRSPVNKVAGKNI
jgi:transposase InsO family protein